MRRYHIFDEDYEPLSVNLEGNLETAIAQSLNILDSSENGTRLLVTSTDDEFAANKPLPVYLTLTKMPEYDSGRGNE